MKQQVLFLLIFIICTGTLSHTHQPTSAKGGTETYLPIVMQAGEAINEGRVNFMKEANSGFDEYTFDPSPATQMWIQEHFWRMLTFSPYFDERLSWYPDAWVYIDLYAIYVGSDLADERPEWILRDADGNELYIPWGCENGTCPQYAADVGNSDFRDYWIAEAADIMSAGYVGMWIDDVNLEWRVGDGNGDFVPPIDPRSGVEMTLDDWQRYFAEFTEEVSYAFPDSEIAHNAIWFADETDNPYVIRQTDAADYINLERGVNDEGIVGGDGQFGFETFLAYIDFVHGRGKNVLFEAVSLPTWEEHEYGLAVWFLINDGNDAMGTDSWSTPDDWWVGYDVDLGSAQGERYEWNELFRRDFACGFVLVNQPDSPTRTVPLGGTYTLIDGSMTSSVTLNETEGVVLLDDCTS